MFFLAGMYEDYPTIYETNLNEYIIPILIGLGLLLLALIISLIALMRIFKKANRSGIGALIPIYNLIIMLEIVHLPILQLLLFLVPGINLFLYGKVMYKIAKSFRKSDSFAFGTIFLPFIFLPILGFGDSEYIGINEEALTGDSIATDLPIITNDIEPEIIKAENERPKIDMSIGGGIYQKDYQQSLLQIPETEVRTDMLASFRVEPEGMIPVQEEHIPEGAELFQNIEYVDSQAPLSAANTPEPINLPNFNSKEPIIIPDAPQASLVEEQPIIIPDTSHPSLVEEQSVIIPDIIQTSLIQENPFANSAVVQIPEINSELVPKNNISLPPEFSASEQPVEAPFSTPIPIPEIPVEMNALPELIPVSDFTENQNMSMESSIATSSPTNKDLEYIICPNCGAKIKSGAPRCFMCGKGI